MKTWDQFLLEMGGNYEYHSTQINIPEPLANEIKKWAKEFIDDEDVYNKDGLGRDNEPHVTLLYGLHNGNSNEVDKVLEGEKPVKLALKETSIFEPELYDVLKLTVESSDLRRLNKKIAKNCPHTNSYKNYSPHCTLAYLKKGKGKKYINDKKFNGTTLTVDVVCFCKKDGNKIKIKLTS